MIYLIGEDIFEGVENLILTKIKFFNFQVNLNDFDALIITSKNALKSLIINNIKINKNINIYTLGQQSANIAYEMGFKNIKISKRSYAKDLLKEFLPELKIQKCLYLRAKEISSNLDNKMKYENIDFTQIIAYENISKEPNIKELIHPAIFIFTSSLGVKNFLSYFNFDLKDKIIAIGKSTAKELSIYKDQLYISQKQDLKYCIALAKKLNKLMP